MQDFAVMHDAVLNQSRRYGEIRIPAVVVAGDRDEIVWTDLHSHAFVQAVPGARLILMPGLGHMPQYADGKVVLAAIEDLAERIATDPLPAASRMFPTWAGESPSRAGPRWAGREEAQNLTPERRAPD
jgi:hypothetical protein